MSISWLQLQQINYVDARQACRHVDNGSTTVSASHTALYYMQSILSWVGPNKETASSYIISLQTVTTGKLIYSISINQ